MVLNYQEQFNIYNFTNFISGFNLHKISWGTYWIGIPSEPIRTNPNHSKICVWIDSDSFGLKIRFRSIGVQIDSDS